MNEKIVRLFNGKHAIIYIDSKDDIAFYVRAIDSEGLLIGACNFSITKIFSRPVTEQQRILSATLRRIPVEKVPHSLDIKITKQNYDKHKDHICGDILTLATGNKFKFKSSFCDLASIDILDTRFSKVGLGTAMYKELEQIAKDHNCTHVEGHFHPHGAFQHGTRDFYKRNGFRFTPRGGLTYIEKDLPHTTTKISQEKEKAN